MSAVEMRIYILETDGVVYCSQKEAYDVLNSKYMVMSEISVSKIGRTESCRPN